MGLGATITQPSGSISVICLPGEFARHNWPPLGVNDAAAVLHLLHMPDPEQRRQYQVALAKDLMQFERPMPVMDEYDLLLAGTSGGIQ
jgi:hypothetical protein